MKKLVLILSFLFSSFLCISQTIKDIDKQVTTIDIAYNTYYFRGTEVKTWENDVVSALDTAIDFTAIYVKGKLVKTTIENYYESSGVNIMKELYFNNNKLIYVRLRELKDNVVLKDMEMFLTKKGIRLFVDEEIITLDEPIMSELVLKVNSENSYYLTLLK